MTPPYRLFLLEDNPSQVRLMELAVAARAELELVGAAETLRDALDALRTLEVDVLVADLMVPDSAGLDTVRAFRAAHPAHPLVVVSSTEDPAMLEGAMRLGAQDYLIKRGAIDGAEVARVVRNAAERQRMADALRHSEKRFRDLLAQASDGIFVTDAEGRLVMVNERAAAMTGYAERELTGRTLRDLFGAAGADGGGLWDALDESSEPIRFETSLQGARGLRIPVEASARRLSAGGVQAIVRDIRERKSAEARLRMLESVVVHAKDAVMITDAGSLERGPRVLYVNEAFATMSGYGNDDLVGRSPAQLEGPDTEADAVEAVRAAFRDHVSADVEILHYRKDGVPYRVAMDVVPVFDADGRCTHFTSIQRDVTEVAFDRRLEDGRREVLERIVRHEGLAASMGAILALVRDQVPAARPFVTQRQGDRLVYLHAGDLPAPYVEATENTAIAHGTTASCLAARSGDAVYVADVGPELASAGLEPTDGLDAPGGCYALPIVSSDATVVGTVAAFRTSSDRTTEREAKVLGVAAQLAAVALDHHRLIEELERQALHDTLTGLPNRTLMEDRLDTALAAADREGNHVAVFFIDLDDFKKVNDTLGHHTGDVLLQRIGERLQGCMRRKDTVARIGGDEFAVVVGDVDDLERVGSVATKILAEFERPLVLHDRELYVTTTIGVSVYPRDGVDRTDLLRKADLAMYRAKQTGQSSFQFFAVDMTGAAHDRLALESDLRAAIAADGLELHFQPILRLSDRTPIAAEALLRWNHRTRGWVSPGQFIPLVDNTGLVVPVGRWVLGAACAEIVRRRNEGAVPARIAVNMSARHFARPDFFAMIQDAVERHELRAGELELEVTESAVMHDLDRAASRLRDLRALGVRIAIDDFGTGYSSLAYLQRLPLDAIKIDRAFVEALGNGERGSRALVEAVVKLGRGLGVDVVAEGIEDEGTAELLREMGCDFGQGFLWGRPARSPTAPELPAQPSTSRRRNSSTSSAPNSAK